MDPGDRATTSLVEELRAIGSDQRQAVFACGGSVALIKPVQVHFTRGEEGEEEAHVDSSRPAIDVIEFPGQPDDANAINRLVAACHPATGSKGDEAAQDLNDRSVLTLPAGRWMTSFELAECTILDEIRSLLAPDAAAVLAHPYKLDVYAKGGSVKAHMDTPRTGSVLGTLVVCLPSLFEGGAFEVEHDGQTHAFEWEGELQVDDESGSSSGSEDDESDSSSSSEDDESDSSSGSEREGDGQGDSPRPTKRAKQDVAAARLSRPAARWCAFYSDCSRQVLEVTSGHRVTLTYLLESVNSMPVGDIRSVEGNQFFHKLRELVKSSEVATGDRIGFALEHEYVVDDDGTMPLLKGFDRFLKYALEVLELKYSFEMVFLAEDLDKTDDYDDESEEEEDSDATEEGGDAAEEELDGKAAFIGKWKTAGGAVRTGYGGSDAETVAHSMIGATGPERVTWICMPSDGAKCYTVYSALSYRDGEVSGRKYHAFAAFLATI